MLAFIFFGNQVPSDALRAPARGVSGLDANALH